MSGLPHNAAGSVATIVVAAIAIVTDVTVRRIPNVLTLPAAGLGVGLGLHSSGWVGALAAVGGATLCPLLLVIVHAGRRPGMGDLKLALAVGSLLGPVAGGLAMLVSAALGGLVAIAWMCRPGAPWSALLIGIPLVGRLFPHRDAEEGETPGRLRLPYGVALGLGSAVTAVATGWR